MGADSEILKQTKADVAVWLITFGLTAFTDLTIAVEVGMILAALLYIHKVTATTSVSQVTQQYIDSGVLHRLQLNPIPNGAVVSGSMGPLCLAHR